MLEQFKALFIRPSSRLSGAETGKPPPTSVLPMDHQVSLNLEIFKFNSAMALNRITGIQQLSQLGLRLLFLLNGGAIIGMFTVIGHLTEIQVSVGSVLHSFGWFVSGLVFVMLAFLSAYISQNAFFQQEVIRTANVAEITSTGKIQTVVPALSNLFGLGFYAAVVCAIGSLICFSIGASVVLNGVTETTTAKAVKSNVVHSPRP